MAVSFNSVVSFNSTVSHHCTKKTYAGASSINFGESQTINGRSQRLSLRVANGDKVYIDSKEEGIGSYEGSVSTGQPESDPTPDNSASQLGAQPSEAGNRAALSEEPQGKKTPLTAREKLRAARVVSRYGAPKPKANRAKLGSSVLDALKESDKGKKSGLPEAPTNLLDDSKRGMPKAGLTFDLPGGRDLLIIAFSFVFISTVMFATTYIVWKLGAIHFNEN
uniref:Uncharacterized protein n=1 Tax=Kalanchoe fedtschenkoi TaxID=63787 RepID=A0A7N0RIZ6_KALFE